MFIKVLCLYNLKCTIIIWFLFANICSIVWIIFSFSLQCFFKLMFAFILMRLNYAAFLWLFVFLVLYLNCQIQSHENLLFKINIPYFSVLTSNLLNIVKKNFFAMYRQGPTCLSVDISLFLSLFIKVLPHSSFTLSQFSLLPE